MRLTVLVFAAGLLSPACAFSQEIMGFASGNELFEECNRGGVGSDYCYGYIQGAHDGAVSTVRALNIEHGPFCLPREAKKTQIVDVVTNYLRAHPEQRHYAAADLVTSALITAFPCK